MTENDLPFDGSWKGLIIDAIVNQKAKSWEDVARHTDIPRNRINSVLKTLYIKGIIKKDQNDNYLIKDKEILEKYKENQKHKQDHAPKKTVDRKKDVLTEIKDEKSIEDETIKKKEYIKETIIKILANSPDEEVELRKTDSFFVSDGNLTSVSQKLVNLAQSSISIINPFIGDCRITQDLIQLTKPLKVEIITRHYNKAMPNKRTEFKNMHQKLESKYQKPFYKDNIHAKIIIIDNVVALISSMNLFIQSNEQSREAGTVIFNDSQVSQSQEFFWKLKSN